MFFRPGGVARRDRLRIERRLRAHRQPEGERPLHDPPLRLGAVKDRACRWAAGGRAPTQVRPRHVATTSPPGAARGEPRRARERPGAPALGAAATPARARAGRSRETPGTRRGGVPPCPTPGRSSRPGRTDPGRPTGSGPRPRRGGAPDAGADVDATVYRNTLGLRGYPPDLPAFVEVAPRVVRADFRDGLRRWWDRRDRRGDPGCRGCRRPPSSLRARSPEPTRPLGLAARDAPAPPRGRRCAFGTGG